MTWWPVRPAAVMIDSGWNCTAHRLARASSMAMATSPAAAVTVNPPPAAETGAYSEWYLAAVNSG